MKLNRNKKTTESIITRSTKYKNDLLALKTGLESVNTDLTERSKSIDDQIKQLKEEKLLVDNEKTTNISVVSNVEKILGMNPIKN